MLSEQELKDFEFRAETEGSLFVRRDMLIALLATIRELQQQGWVRVEEGLPEHWDWRGPKPYQLVCDATGRMSVAFLREHHPQAWTMAKPIGPVTHWRPLPAPPTE